MPQRIAYTVTTRILGDLNLQLTPQLLWAYCKLFEDEGVRVKTEWGRIDYYVSLSEGRTSLDPRVGDVVNLVLPMPTTTTGWLLRQ